MPRERAVAFVVARLSSERLPEKQLRTVGAVPILTRIIETLRTCRELDETVIATVSEPENLKLARYAEETGTPLFWYEGAVNDVTTRLKCAGEKFGAEICLLISADCPLVHAPSVDELIARMRREPGADALYPGPDAEGRHCLMEGVQIARLKAWRRADELSDRPELKEHQFPVIYRNPGLFNLVYVGLSAPVYGARHRMSVDTWADLEFMETLYARLTAAGRPFDLPNAVWLLTAHPEVKELNAHVHQRALVEDIKKVLVICDAGGEWGYGHFTRMRELSGQITERLSWPVTFLMDDERAARMAGDCGFRTLWGALGRETRTPPEGVAVTGAVEAANGRDLVAVDISARRSPPPGWRSAFPEGAAVAVIDRADAFAKEADLAVFPGVAGREASEGVNTAGGADLVIMRREVRRYADAGIAKDIDVLSYLPGETERRELEKACAEEGLIHASPSGFAEDFPLLLARSRVFVSGYGQSFYEALHLKAVPVCWPLSPLHRADAQAFYAAFGLAPLVVDGPGEWTKALSAALAVSSQDFTRPVDGTPRIVEILAGLMIRRGE